MSTLKNAINGETVYIPVSQIGMNYDTQQGFPSLADLTAWCMTFNLQYETVTINDEVNYKISPINN